MNTLKFQSQLLIRILVAVILAAAIILTGMTVFASSKQSPASANAPQAAALSGSKMTTQEFQNAMRKLWEEHVVWTRLYIISVAGNLPDKDVTAQRLLQNQDDIGNAVKPFYGDAAGNQLTALLKDHILIAAAILDDVKAGNNDQAKVDIQKWYDNADQIAVFLSNANPKNWPVDTMKAQMKMHLDLTLAEASDRLSGKYADDVKDYDAIENHILGMADILSSGIIQQFPNNFNH